MQHQILPTPQRHTQLLLLPAQPIIQQQLRVSKHARVEQRRLVAAEEPQVVAEERGERLEGLVRLAVEIIRVDDGALLQELGFGRGAQRVRDRGAHERAGGGGRDVEFVCDGGEV